jgi:hypothetical protein
MRLPTAHRGPSRAAPDTSSESHEIHAGSGVKACQAPVWRIQTPVRVGARRTRRPDGARSATATRTPEGRSSLVPTRGWKLRHAVALRSKESDPRTQTESALAPLGHERPAPLTVPRRPRSRSSNNPSSEAEATCKRPNDWRISCRPSCARPHEPLFLSALTEGAARAEPCARPAYRLHARVRRWPAAELRLQWPRLRTTDHAAAGPLGSSAPAGPPGSIPRTRR